MSKVTFAPKTVFGTALFAGALILAKYSSINNITNEEKVYNSASTSVKSLKKPHVQAEQRAVLYASKTVSVPKSLKSAKRSNIEDYDANASIAIATGNVVSAETLGKKDTLCRVSDAFKYYRLLIDDDAEEYTYGVDDNGRLIIRYPNGVEELYEGYDNK